MKYVYGDKGFLILNEYIEKQAFSNVFIITDENTKKYCLPIFQERFNKFTNVNILSGEKNKNIETLSDIWNELLLNKGDRKSLIINLGGGVVTDIGGFAAATFKRGIKFIHIPTSLLAMVDAAIGGKNGINFMGIKNQIGTIVPAEMVFIYPGFLKTLPENELKSGYAEMLKHGLIADISYWNELKKHHREMLELKDMPLVLQLIKKSVEIKNQVITTDPYEQGLRKILNYGHTLGHAIESLFNYDRKQSISHGKAVAIGMVLASYISSKLFDFDKETVDEIKIFINSVFSVEKFTAKERLKIIDYLIYDKKNEKGKVNFVLLKKIGEPVWNIQVRDNIVQEAFDYYSADD